ncbi:MAG: acetate--CoA ligase family protein [Synergistaceae bacterium]|jgi:acetyltransferase|nr:acetate--CoA ligase family protein [Synergistaceae bacterium]
MKGESIMLDLQAMFYPGSVAVFGSAGEGRLANVLTGRLLDGGMKRVCIVNPKKEPVRGAKGYASLLEVPEPVDLAVVASPANTVKGILEDCGKTGVKAAVIISSGFSEAGNAEGERELAATAKRYGIRFIGPNCAGMVSTHARLAATLETAPPAGNISLISQSGAVGGSFMALSADDGVGIAKFISYGNGGDLTVLELLRYLKEDPETKVIALYLETVSNGREFMETVQEVRAVKPVVIVKAGRTNTGQRAALSHTGSMAGADAVCDAALRQCGAIRADTLQSLFDLSKGFATLPPVRGRRLLVVTNSGGPGVMTADKAETEGLLIQETSDTVKAALREFLPSFAGLRNPIDLTVEGTGEQYERAITTALSESDAAVALYIGTPYLKAMPVAQGVAAAAKKSGKPVAAVMQVGSDIGESLKYLREEGCVPCFTSGERAVSALAAMAAYEERKSTRKGSCLAQAEPVENAGGVQNLLEPEAMRLLRGSGIPVPQSAFAQDEEQAVASCQEIGYPVVLKIVSPRIIHKSDCGGVVLNVRGEEGVRSAFRKLRAIGEGRDFRGVVIYPMLTSGKEVIIGLSRDPDFGPLVAFGMGGIYTEALKDITFRVAPIDREQALEMIREIKMYPLLNGVRGEAPGDVGALAEVIAAFSRLPLLYPDIAEADLNPVFVYEKGVLAADVRILGKQR